MNNELLNALFAPDWDRNDFIKRFSGTHLDTLEFDSILCEVEKNYQSVPELSDAYSRLAYLCWGEGKKKLARELWKKDLDNDRISWFQLLKYADSFAAEEDLNQAIALVEKAYNLFPESKGGYGGLAWRIKGKSPDRAFELFEKDLSLDRASVEFLIKHAILLAQNLNLDRAEEILNLASQEDVSLEKAYHQIAEILMDQNEWQKVVDFYQRAPFDNWFKKSGQKDIENPEKESDNKTLYAFYDFWGAGPTFDITSFLSNAEKYRQKIGLESIKVVFVPASPKRFPQWYPLGQEPQEWRFQNILLPCCSMLPTCSSVIQCATRDEAASLESRSVKHRFPLDYAVNCPTIDFHWRGRCLGDYGVHYLKPPETALRYVRAALKRLAGDRKVITITLRETSQVDKDRNSRIGEWMKFIESLDKEIFFPIILRDQEKGLESAPEEWRQYLHLSETLWNLPMRAALYELAYMNLGVNNGPMTFALYNSKVRVLVFKMLTEESYQASAEFCQKHCVDVGGQLSFCTPFQKLIWENDDFDVINREFRGMLSKIESS